MQLNIMKASSQHVCIFTVSTFRIPNCSEGCQCGKLSVSAKDRCLGGKSTKSTEGAAPRKLECADFFVSNKSQKNQLSSKWGIWCWLQSTCSFWIKTADAIIFAKLFLIALTQTSSFQAIITRGNVFSDFHPLITPSVASRAFLTLAQLRLDQLISYGKITLLWFSFLD